jgi:hypothetical protein
MGLSGSKQKTETKQAETQTAATTQNNKQDSKTTISKEIEKLNFNGPDYSAVWDPKAGGYTIKGNEQQTALEDQRLGGLGDLLSLISSNGVGTKQYGLDSPETMAMAALINQGLDTQGAETMNSMMNQTYGNREAGSSFDAARQGKFAGELSKAKQGSALTALDYLNKNQAQDVQNYSSLANLLQGSKQTPLFDPINYLAQFGKQTTKGTESMMSNAVGNTTGNSNLTSTSTQTGSGGLGQIMASLAGSAIGGLAGNPAAISKL